ncbi:tetratricopeptide repeat protein [Tamlana fucoidanivorans]|uniref:Tetratricopeptide repeat protein n=1 Tax=Allotamlana fucoidanivorans TaxID=2583814 RepID=A0A5C4SI53_9FLAO|nr:tetratricopeptide repeat protein [Tamlana fucoidanivorans]TNJ43160.1 tetratricopeptide repeat protein [Tamlana fucoidanivorans]
MKTFSLWFVGALLAVLTSCREEKKEYISAQEPIETVFKSTDKIPDSHFLGDEKCKACHDAEYKLWQGSHHDKAMQEVKASTVLGDFNNVTFKSQGVTSRFYKKGEDYYVNTEGPDGKYHDYNIVYVFGITPLQQYIVKFPNGHYQCLRTAWDTEKNKWFDLYPDFKVVHSEWLHWSRGGLNWNTMCSDCHSTNVRKNYDLQTHSYDTKYALINVSCEACHGPGKTHVEQVNKLGDAYKGAGDLKMTPGIDSEELIDQCARCHIRREQITEYFNFEGSLLDHYFPQLIEENLYYPDGQILDEVYVYGSFVQSKMYQNGVMCTDCHNPHSLKLKFEGNKLCAQCHVPETYDTPSHHFHESGTESAQCVNCHMTGKYYMGNDFRRDHSFRIPRPDLSLKYGSPNACKQCHDDKDDAWAWENYQALFGKPKNKHFSELLAPGITGAEHGIESLMELVLDTIYPEISRASAVKSMTNYLNPEVINNMLRFLNDDSALVRGATLDVLGSLDSPDYLEYYLPLLKDEKRAVRVKTFFALGAFDELQIPQAYKEVYSKVKKEFNASLNVTSDFVGGRVKRANYELKKGNLLEAIKWYEKALEIDNINNIARTNLANLYYRNGDFEKAEQAFKTIIKQEPDFGQTYFSYALLLAELNRYDEAIAQMKLAIDRMPNNIRLYYNLSLLYDKSNDLKNAEKYAALGLKKAPQNESLLYMLAYVYSKSGDIQKATNVCETLVNLYPNNSNYVTFYNQLRGQLAQQK